MTFVRTILGDIAPTELGITYAHEHLVIGPSHTVDEHPDFLLVDIDRAVEELASAQALGLRSVVDAMPIGAGRDVQLLAECLHRSGVIERPAIYAGHPRRIDRRKCNVRDGVSGEQ